MAPETGTALIVLVAFVLPGFVAVLISERTYEVPVRQRSPFELLLLTAYYSALSYVLVALITWPFGLDRGDIKRMYREESIGQLGGLALLAIVVVPAAIATVGRTWMRFPHPRIWALKILGIQESHRVATAWDELFRRRRPAMVRAILSDGRVVCGYYGPRSFAGYGEESRDLLLEQRWELDEDHWFHAPIEGSHGVWLPRESVVTLELYDVVYGETEEDTAYTDREEGRLPADVNGAGAEEASSQAG
jgi:hypothetical protein